MGDIFKGFDLKKGTSMQMGIQGAGTLLNGWQAYRAKVDYGNKMNEIKAYEASRQPVINPYGGIKNPYANLPVATQAAEIQMEQTDQALAATLDTLRETGASAGGATALAQAALQSKQGISAGIEKQETDNAKLKAQGQLQVDVIKGKGEMERFKNQEVRDLQQLDRLQSQADILKGQEILSKNNMMKGLGAVSDQFTDGMVSQDQINPNDSSDETGGTAANTADKTNANTAANTADKTNANTAANTADKTNALNSQNQQSVVSLDTNTNVNSLAGIQKIMGYDDDLYVPIIEGNSTPPN